MKQCLEYTYSRLQVQRCYGLMRTNGCEIRGTGLEEGQEYVDDLDLGKVRSPCTQGQLVFAKLPIS